MSPLAQRAVGLAWAAAVVINAIAFAHAWRFTHFTTGEKTPSPEELSLVEKVGVLLTGVRVPRPELRGTAPEAPEVLHDGVSTWVFDADRPECVALFHGYGGVKSDLLAEAAIFRELGFCTLLTDFRGGGASEGSTTTLGWSEADVVADVAARFEADVLYGKSMGAAAILRAVGVLGVNADALILENPFDRLVTTVGHRFESMGLPAFPGAQLLVFWGGLQLGYDGFAHDPLEYARGVRTRTLLLHGERDPRVHLSEVEAIAAALAGEHQLRVFPGAGHGGLLAADAEAWRTWVGEWLAG